MLFSVGSSGPSLLPDPHTSLRRRTVASLCLNCGKPLCDATSATIGLGPNCRKRLGIARLLKGNQNANDLIARAALAAENGRLRDVRDLLTQLVAVDNEYQTLADRVQARLFRTRVTFVDRGYHVTSTFNDTTVSAFRDLRMRWVPSRKAWLARDDHTLNRALNALAEAQPGGDVLTPAGEIVPLATWRV